MPSTKLEIPPIKAPLSENTEIANPEISAGKRVKSIDTQGPYHISEKK